MCLRATRNFLLYGSFDRKNVVRLHLMHIFEASAKQISIYVLYWGYRRSSSPAGLPCGALSRRKLQGIGIHGTRDRQAACREG
jgi:hypothetical protein